MYLQAVRLRHFRNIGEAFLRFSGEHQFFVGPNGQGKSNLLEAIAFLTALRSFRTRKRTFLIREGQPAAEMAFSLEHEIQGETEIVMRLGKRGLDVDVDGEPQRRFGDYIGVFPTVVLASQDIQVLRGAPGARRRFFDLLFAATRPEYYAALTAYHRTLKERNALLRAEKPSPDAVLKAFDQQLAEAGARLVRERRRSLADLREPFHRAYCAFADAAESPRLDCRERLAETDAGAYHERLMTNRRRDRAAETTLLGPHRDDYTFGLQEREAREFASDGQQRALVVALRLAEADLFRARQAVRPLLLADDILGELDPGRRRRFWEAVEADRGLQVLATGTVRPETSDQRPWQIFHVGRGVITQADTDAAADRQSS
ncbi:MAG: DNA replication/repair protein RecF [Opitutales bacterium]